MDRRTVAARGDLADVRVADKVFAPHYAAAVARVAVARAPVVANHGGEPLSEILPGEAFDVLEMSHGLAWGLSVADGVVGYVALNALGAPVETSHIVCAGPAAGARLTAEQAATADARTIRPLDAPAKDIAALAESLVGTPRATGGRSGAGVDPAGFVHLVMTLAGLPCPRFADLQAELGHAVAGSAPVLRGDLIVTDDGIAVATGEDAAIRVGARAVEAVAVSELEITGRRRLP